jgi:hypothetical protein
MKTFSAILIIASALALQGCAFLAGAAAGAAGNEALEEEGYELENPVQKEDDDE